jgi:ABC-2 type transport system permease protein
MRWRFQNPISIIITVIQPLIWLVLYSSIAGQTMKSAGIVNYTGFILPGLFVLVTFAACSSGGIINFITKTNGSFYRIMIAPLSRKAIVAGQLLECVLLSFLEVGILWLVSLLFSVKVQSGWSGFALITLILFLTALFISGITYTISLSLPNEVVYETLMNAIVLPIFFLSSALFPADKLSGGLAMAVNLNPFTHIIDVLQMLVLGDTIHFTELIPVILLLTVMSLVSFALAAWRLKQETVQ